MNEALWDEIETFLAAEGVDLDDLDLKGGGKARILRVTVDAEGGLGVDRIADLSRGLSRLLDENDSVPGSYTLEVTSPGLERPLRRREHYEKSVGREVVLKTSVPVDGESSHRGVLEAVAGDEAIVKVGEEQRAIPFDSVTGARTVYRWEAKAKPGRK
jgi:ribosome maturation factor RimP